MLNENEAKPIKKGDVEEAFDAMARFLFEQYKKKKQADELAEYVEAQVDQS